MEFADFRILRQHRKSGFSVSGIGFVFLASEVRNSIALLNFHYTRKLQISYVTNSQIFSEFLSIKKLI